MRVLPLSEFRANASAMLDLVAQGETVRIMRHGKPVADLVPVVSDAAPVQLPSWQRPLEPVRYLRQPSTSGAELIAEQRQPVPSAV